MRRVALFLVLIVSLTVAGVAFGQEPPPGPPTDDQVNAIAKNMYCPVCENVPLDVCPTLACEQWREQIREKLAEGLSEQQIYDFFVLQYGDRVLAQPPRRGLNWLIYVVPPAAILAGGFVLYRALRAWQRPRIEPPPSQAPPETSGDDYVTRLEQELEKRR